MPDEAKIPKGIMRPIVKPEVKPDSDESPIRKPHRVRLTFKGTHVGTVDVTVPPTVSEDDVFNAAVAIAADTLGVTRDEKGRPRFGVQPDMEYLDS